ncbi:hypothetical protein [Aminipila luticellarii]|uniref:Acetylglutamate kinase n=1 Tax=Aminipila luticellarii TaxID=2507160 RepID=A0A410PSW2_9FIRM|nr:hypothetical protein [Aminipila luticellarii]QAT41976.1 hypothetical protein EQM06_01330 [Aminipila luticellarii]
MTLIRMMQTSCIPESQLNLIFQSRTAWRDLATWMRAYLASKHGGLGDIDAIRGKLNDLLIRFTSTFSLIFGEYLADQYVILLSNALNIFDALVDAQIRGDEDAVAEYTRQLYENTDRRAAFLAEINPYWVESEWKNLLYQFDQKTISQSTTFQNGQFRQNVEVFDSILNLTSLIGDYYSTGLLQYLTFSR